MKKITLIIATILVFALTMSTFANSFSDVPENHWAYDAIVELYNLGIYEGYPDGTFKGDNALTRYEMAMVITRTLENINEEREETLTKIEALEGEMDDLQMSLTGTQQLADLRNSITQKEIDEINEKLEDTMSRLEAIETIQQDLDDLEMSLKGTEQLADLRNSVMQKEVDKVKEQVKAIDDVKEQVAAIEEKLGDKVDVDTIASIEEKIESIKKSGLNTEQAQDVTAIVRAMLKENDLAQGGELTATQETIENLQDLIEEFEEELDEIDMSLEGTSQLADLRHSIMDKRVSELEDRVTVLEEPVITFNGEYGVNFSHVTTDGDALQTEDMEEKGVDGYYYEDPYDVESGWYEDQIDSDTYNEVDDSPDYRLTDEEDYYTAGTTFENTLDLSIEVNKDPITADMKILAMSNVFGASDDVIDYKVDSLEGTISTSNFTATIKDDQEVTFKDYIYDEASVDGVVVDAGEDTYFLARNVEELKEYYGAPVPGEEDNYYSADRDNLLIGARSSVDLLLPFNVYVGYEYAKGGTFTLDDPDNTTATFDKTVDEIKTTLVGLDTSVEMAGFDITSDLAFNLGETSKGGHLFRMGATGGLSILDVAFNYENTADMIFIKDDADEDKVGYDLKLGSSLGPVEGSWKHEDYNIDGVDEVTDTIKLEVPEGELSFVGIDVDGSYELTMDENDGRNEIRNINASTGLAGIELAYTYDYDVDNELYDKTKDRVDNGNNLVDGMTGFDDEASEEDADINKHTIEATYDIGNFTAGAKAEMEKSVISDDNAITFDDFSNTYTLTGRYSQEMYEAGFEKVIGGDLTIDGRVTAPTLTLVGVDFDSNACFKRNIDDSTQNIELNVDATKDVSDKLALTGGVTWADKEIDVDFKGQKTAMGAGAEYSITDDISANADYKYMSFEEDVTGNSYNVSEATAGVSIAF